MGPPKYEAMQVTHNDKELPVSIDEIGRPFSTFPLRYVSSGNETFIGLAEDEMPDKELTPEEQAAQEQQELLARCAEERRVAKEKMLARNAARIKELGSKLKPGETLEQYDDRVKGGK